MIKSLSLVLIVTLLALSPAFAQDANRAQQTAETETQPAEKTSEPQVRQSNLLPSPGQPDTSTEKQSSTTSHKKRNIIIAVVVAVAVGVAVAAHNGLYGSSNGY